MLTIKVDLKHLVCDASDSDLVELLGLVKNELFVRESTSKNLPETVCKHIRAGNKLAAIKELKNLTGCTLMHAKDIVVRYMDIVSAIRQGG